MTSRLHHIGDIVRRVRESRGITQDAVARLAGVNRATINRLETGRTERAADKLKAMRLISEALGDPRIAFGLHLTAEQQNLLLRLTDADIARHVAEEEFGWIDDRTFLDSSRASGLSRLIDNLETQLIPAVIVDPLLFIHAMNGLVPKLLDFNPQQWLYQWDMWHLIGRKMRIGAPPRDRYIDHDHFNHTIAFFFQRPQGVHYLFTRQMGALLDRLDSYAEANDHPFVQKWDMVTKFQLPMKLASIPREIKRLDGRQLRLEAKILAQVPVRFARDVDVTFTVIGWDVVDDAGRQLLAEWRGGSTRQDILYVGEFGAGRAFHVNQWPEVAAPR